jgi:hypothetical protein
MVVDDVLQFRRRVDQISDVDREDKRRMRDPKSATLASSPAHNGSSIMRSRPTAPSARMPNPLGQHQWAQLLQQTLDEEKQTDSKLNSLVERISVEAKAA